MHAALRNEAYIVSIQPLYLRLIPHKADGQESKRLVRTVPVKLQKANKTLCNRLADADFTFAIKKQMRGIVSLLGSDNVFVLSQDDKSKVTIVVTAARKQVPLLMHVSYEIRLPDHDFVKVTKQKSKLSVYGSCKIKLSSSRADLGITYSGPS